MTGLPPFSGRAASCPKCGTGLDTTWHLICLHNGFPCRRVRPPRHFEHMCRTCPCCGWGRIEATVNSEVDTPDLRSLPGGAG